jgi:DNA-binding NarL/FixJ family response regulator
MIRLVIIDSNENYRKKVELLLSIQSDFAIIGTGKDGYDALMLTRTMKPDVILLDINLSYLGGIEVTSIIKCQFPNISIIILTNMDNDEYVLKTIYSGASGYLLKNLDTEKLADSIRTVYNGGSLLTPCIATKAFRIFSNMVRKDPKDPKVKTSVLPLNISKTDLQVIRFIGQGLSNREIASKMKLQEGTVRNRVTLILQKTGLRDRTQIAIFAIQQGLNISEYPGKNILADVRGG